MAPEELKRRVDVAIHFSPESFHSALPSIALSNDGQTLQSLLLISDNYLCEVQFQLIGDGITSVFDFAFRKSIRNYRIELWKQNVKEGEVVKASFDVAKVTLVHDLRLTTTLNYAGNERDEWLRDVTTTLPIATLIDASPVANAMRLVDALGIGKDQGE